MAENVMSLSSLKLSVDQRELVANLAGDLIAVQVYRELQRVNAAADSGCNIIGNCSCSSKHQLLEIATR